MIAVSPLLGWLYRKFFLSPRLQVSLAPLLEGNVGLAGGNPPTQRMKSQALLLKAKRGPIHNCKAKFVTGQAPPQYMSWDTHRDVEAIPQTRTLTRDLLPSEEVTLTVWEAFKRPDGEWFSLNAGEDMFRNRNMKEVGGGSVSFEIWFLSEEGLPNKKPHRYEIRMDSWATINTVAIT